MGEIRKGDRRLVEVEVLKLDNGDDTALVHVPGTAYSSFWIGNHVLLAAPLPSDLTPADDTAQEVG